MSTNPSPAKADAFVLAPQLVQVFEQQAKVFGCSAEVDWLEDKGSWTGGSIALQTYYPPTVNDVSALALAKDVASRQNRNPSCHDAT